MRVQTEPFLVNSYYAHVRRLLYANSEIFGISAKGLIEKYYNLINEIYCLIEEFT